MITPGSRNRFSYGQSFDAMIDFCIWTLEQDGLHISPFEYHADGNGSLRAAGLTVHDWKKWFHAIIKQYQSFKTGRDHFPHLALPAELWSGKPDVKPLLHTLWEQYSTSIGAQRSRIQAKIHKKWNLAESLRKRRLWDELQVYRDNLTDLSVILVHYDQPLNYLLPPTTLLLTFTDQQPDGDMYRQQMISAAEELASQPMEKRIFPETYETLPPGIPGQPLRKYHLYQKHSVTPSKPPVSVKAENEQQQAILDGLANGTLGTFEADLSTVRFLEGKTVGDWHLQYYTYNDTAGRPNDSHSFLNKDRHGNWHWSESSSSLREENPPWSIVVHTNPSLFLMGNLAVPEHWNTVRDFHAGGKITVPDASIARVRLVDKRGQTMEDTVEQGLVLFTRNRPLKSPVRAELYNAAGMMVRQQRVLNFPIRLYLLLLLWNFRRKFQEKT